VRDGVGSVSSVTLDYGWWHPTLLADHLTLRLQSLSFMAAATVSFAPSTGKFLFSLSAADSATTNYGLDFSFTQSSRLARALGFVEGHMYDGARVYESPRRAISGHLSLPAQVQPVEPARWAIQPAPERLALATAKVQGAGVDAFLVSISSQSQLIVDGAGAPIVHHWLSPSAAGAGAAAVQISDGTDFVSMVAVAGATGAEPNALTIATQTSPITFGSGVADELDDADEPFHVKVLDDRGAFEVYASAPLSRAHKFPATDLTGAAIRDPIGDPQARAVGTGRVYGGVNEVAGLGESFQRVQGGNESVWVAPWRFTTDPPDYVLVELVRPDGQSTRHVAMRAGGNARADPINPNDSRSILARLVLTDGYAQIVEYHTYVALAGPRSVDEVKVRFIHPDFSLVDWQGRDHSWGLLVSRLGGVAEKPVLMG